ncbi:MAG TPA: polyprenyl synthetase family protein [Sedimentisphaerales bacterium]|nr:polyprenyl synthetase family protein [Sedimentisphaerales bacterium]HRS11363.1 polyprenyl synthetase family protein [Sedimentisphaerales bacterium]HRV47935.1 polyprenyl synthetase family protein [Sedimentisphaerales bacterium]
MSDDRVLTARPVRPPQDNVPQTKQERDKLLAFVREYVRVQEPVPPLSIDELRVHTEAVLRDAGMDRKYSEYAAVLVNNEVWRETVAAIPYEKRLLLLPKCLRSSTDCPASFDDLGLLCEHCGRCPIDELTSQAERLGYAVLVAEGSPVVMSLIETGQIETVVGVSCLSVLARVFPYMEAGAVPGVAIPLLRDGCADTSADLDWVWEAIYQTTDDQTRRLDLDALHRQVNDWFSREALTQMIAPRPDPTEQVALDWMAKAGKRWRPFLGVCTYKALMVDGSPAADLDLQRVAVAVECFHKASLVHDDIEDGDAHRYGEKTLHSEHGVPIALNVGDLLLGEGYRLLVETDASDARKARLLHAAVQGHRALCLGQGRELAWAGAPKPLAVADVLEIFRLKTAPAFEVALRLCAILAGCDDQVGNVLKQYSDSLGIAYQIRDDLEDLRDPERLDLCVRRRPSVLLALAYEMGDEETRRRIERQWDPSATEADREQVRQMIATPQVELAAMRLTEAYKAQAIGSLIALKNANLKGLLRRVMARIFNDFEIMGCCNDRPLQRRTHHE